MRLALNEVAGGVSSFFFFFLNLHITRFLTGSRSEC
jgi:hypothetical protein